DALLASHELDLVMTVGSAQPGRLRRAGRAHPHENLEPLADGTVERTVADPVDVAQPDAIHPQRLARADDDTARRRIELPHIERMAGGDAQSLALADGEMRNAVMRAEHLSVEVDDITGVHRIRLQPADDVGVAAGRHEADVLAVVLVGDLQTKAARMLAHL